MKMPNPQRAVVEIEKLRNYCLNPDHWRGRHKARVFLLVMRLTAEHAGDLRDALLGANAFEVEFCDNDGRTYASFEVDPNPWAPFGVV